VANVASQAASGQFSAQGWPWPSLHNCARSSGKPALGATCVPAKRHQSTLCLVPWTIATIRERDV